MHRSLIIAPQWIGDAVMTQPLVATLARRGEVVAVAALPWVAPVYRAMGAAVATVIDLPFSHGKLQWRARAALGQSWRRRYDVAYVLPNSAKAALLPWFAQIERRVGYLGEHRYVLLNDRLPNPVERDSMVAFYQRLAGGRPPEQVPQPVLSLPAACSAAAAAKFELEAGRYWVFAPGAEFGPAKCWPPGHYADLARRLHAETGRPIVLLGSGKELALAEHIAAMAQPADCRVLAGRTSLDEAMAIVAGSAGVVSNDSGLMHVAAAFGRAQVALFGSTSPLHTPPLNVQARVLWLKDELGLDCAPCFKRTCMHGHLRCLQEIAPARVLAALYEQVAQHEQAVPEARPELRRAVGAH